MDAATMVRTARRRAGLTQRELARRSGIPQPTISRIERGLMSPTFDTLRPLIEATGMDLQLREHEGEGVDRSQLRDRLNLRPAVRFSTAVAGSKNVAALVRRARTAPA